MNPVEARAGAASEPGQEKLVTVIQRIWPVVNASQNATCCGIWAKVTGDGKNLPGGYSETGPLDPAIAFKGGAPQLPGRPFAYTSMRQAAPGAGGTPECTDDLGW